MSRRRELSLKRPVRAEHGAPELLAWPHEVGRRRDDEAPCRPGAREGRAECRRGRCRRRARRAPAAGAAGPGAAAAPHGAGGRARPAWCCARCPIGARCPRQRPRRRPRPRGGGSPPRRGGTKRRAEREARDARERDAAEARKRDEEERRRKEDERKRRAEDEARRRLGEEPPAGPRPARSAPGARRRAPAAEPEPHGAPGPVRSPDPAAARPAATPRLRAPRPPASRPDGRGRGQAHHPPPRHADPDHHAAEDAAGAGRQPQPRPADDRDRDRRRGRAHALRRLVPPPHAAADRPPRQPSRRRSSPARSSIPETITIQELANRMSERAVDVIRLLMKQGQMHKITDAIDADTAQLIAEELGHTVKRVAESDVEEGLFDTPDADENLEPRPPVVTIMGHVDHGKTSLLDAIRKTNVVSGEAGGITQHIGAYQVTSPLGGKITFIDTPGHAAFTAMRARGAKVTDIVVLVVAADDGVMPQTVEAITHAKAAKRADDRRDQQDRQARRRPAAGAHRAPAATRSWSSRSAATRSSSRSRRRPAQGLDTLLEGLQLQAEVLDLRAEPDRPAEGTVIEAKLDRGRGPVATVLVQRGTLRTGDIVVAGAEWGRVRALIDDKGANVEGGRARRFRSRCSASTARRRPATASPSSSGGPRPRDHRLPHPPEARAPRRPHVGRPRLARRHDARPQGGRRPQGVRRSSSRPTCRARSRRSSARSRRSAPTRSQARVIHSGVGGITESDITLAGASRRRGHRLQRPRPQGGARGGRAGRHRDPLLQHHLQPRRRREGGDVGHARPDAARGAARRGPGARGVQRLEGRQGRRLPRPRRRRAARRPCPPDPRQRRHPRGQAVALKRFKDDVREVTAGQECGMAFENYQDMRAGDVIECYSVTEVRRTL